MVRSRPMSLHIADSVRTVWKTGQPGCWSGPDPAVPKGKTADGALQKGDRAGIIIYRGGGNAHNAEPGDRTWISKS